MVKEQTAVRVREVADRLGYRPHPLARGLRTNRTLTVGMVVPDLMNPLFPPIYAGAESVLGDLGYSVLVASDDDHPERSREVVAALAERRVDGLIHASAHRDFDHQMLDEIPTVLVNRTTESREFPAIVGDHRIGIGLAVGHLAGLGHTAIAHVAGPQDLSTGIARREAFVEAMRAERLDVHNSLIHEAAAFRTDAGRRACEALLGSGADFTAIVASNDLIALGCYDVLAGRGMSVPADVSVTGYNDMTFIDRVAPPLTTIAVAYREMGATAARRLLTMLTDRGEPPPHDPVLLPPELVIRGSTAPPAPR